MSEEESVEVKSYRIRRFKPEDLEWVIRINRACLPENYPSFFFTHLYENCPEAFLVAETKDGGEIIGYVMCRLEREFAPTSLKVKTKGHIVSLAVMPEHRRKGVATALMKLAEEALKRKGAEELYLEVRVSNEPAIRLYEKLGYKKVKVLKYYYSDGEDAYLMAKEVP